MPRFCQFGTSLKLTPLLKSNSFFSLTDIFSKKSLALIGLGGAVALMSLPTSVWHVMAILFLAGLTITPVQAAGSTIIQTTVPDEMRGRTGSANNALITIAQLVSMAAAGLLADSFGARNVFILGGVIVALAGVVAMLIFRGVDLEPLEISSVPTAEAGD